MKKLPRQAKTVFRIYIIIISFLIFAFLFFLFFFKLLPIGILIAFTVAVFGLFCVCYFFLAEKYYESCKYSCSCKEITVIKGYLLKRKITVLKEKVLFVQIYSNPLQNYFSLCSVGVFCAGTGRILISQINRCDGEKIKEILCEQKC